MKFGLQALWELTEWGELPNASHYTSVQVWHFLPAQCTGKNSQISKHDKGPKHVNLRKEPTIIHKECQVDPGDKKACLAQLVGKCLACKNLGPHLPVNQAMFTFKNRHTTIFNAKVVTNCQETPGYFSPEISTHVPN